MDTINAIIESASDEYMDYGFRFVDGLDGIPSMGDNLANSYDWEADDETELDGVCAFGQWTDLVEYAKHSHGYLMMVTGSDTGSGTEAGEIIIADPKVVAIWSRDTAKAEWTRIA